MHIFIFLRLLLLMLSKKHLPNSWLQIFSPMCSRNFSFRLYTWVYDLFWINFCIWCEVWYELKLIFFGTWISTWSKNVCWKYYSFQTEFPLHICKRSVGHTCVSLFLYSLILFHWSLFTWTLITYCFNYCSFLISLKTR